MERMEGGVGVRRLVSKVELTVVTLEGLFHRLPGVPELCQQVWEQEPWELR